MEQQMRMEQAGFEQEVAERVLSGIEFGTYHEELEYQSAEYRVLPCEAEVLGAKEDEGKFQKVILFGEGEPKVHLLFTKKMKPFAHTVANNMEAGMVNQEKKTAAPAADKNRMRPFAQVIADMIRKK